MVTRSLAVLATAVTCGAIAAPASATSVHLTGNGQSKTLHIDGAAGEVNTPQIWPVNDGGKLVYWVIDYSSSPVAGSGCTQTDVNQVSCPQAPVIAVSVSLGDGDDSFGVTSPLPIPMTVDGGPGKDRLAASDGDDTVTGGTGDDSVDAAGAGADDYSGGDGNDTIVFGRAGDQSISLDDVANDGLAGEGDNAHSDFERVGGGYSADTITGTAGNDALYGGGGADVIHGGGGDDVVGGYGDAGSPHDCSADQVFGDDGNDRIDGTAGGTVDGGTGDDVIATDLLCSGLVVHGGDGHDRVDASSAYYGVAVTLDDAANDGPEQTADANVDGDVEDLTGSSSTDLLVGDDADNRIDGGAGNDALDGAGGADVIVGGDGSDVVDYSGRTLSLQVDLDGQSGDDGESGEGDTVGSDVEGIWGGSAADVLTGGPGDDVIDGGTGADQITGGDGEDAVDYSLRTAAVTADADGAAGDDGEASEGDSIAADVEDMYGGGGADTLTGSGSANYLDGGPGDDTLAGGEGDDALVGGPGSDSLDGGGGADEFFADEGDDSIAMRDGVDESAACGDGADTVTADTGDQTEFDCESVSRPPPPAKPPRPTTTTPVIRPPRTQTPIVSPPPVPATADVTGPSAVFRAVTTPLRNALARGVIVHVSCDENCSATVKVTLSVRTARRLGFKHVKRPLVVATATRPDRSAKTYNIVLRFRRPLRARLAKARSLRLTMNAVFTDGLGNEGLASRVLKLVR